MARIFTAPRLSPKMADPGPALPEVLSWAGKTYTIKDFEHKPTQGYDGYLDAGLTRASKTR